MSRWCTCCASAKDRIMETFSVIPSPKVSDTVVEPYHWRRLICWVGFPQILSSISFASPEKGVYQDKCYYQYDAMFKSSWVRSWERRQQCFTTVAQRIDVLQPDLFQLLCSTRLSQVQCCLEFPSIGRKFRRVIPVG